MSQETKPNEQPDELPRRKWWIPVLVGLVVLAALIYGGRKIYGRVEPERLSRRAKVMIDKGDYRGALITLSRALQINNNSRSATRMMVELTEKLGVPQAVDWHRRLLELNPDSQADAMALAQYALKEKNPEVAMRALDQISASSQGNPEFQTASGVAAIQSGDLKLALKFFGDAAQLEPHNDLIRYNYALAQIQSPEAADRTAGWDALTTLSKGGRAQQLALRTLISRLLQSRKPGEALVHSETLVKLPQAQFRDWLQHSELLQQLQRPGDAATALERAKSMAEDVPDDAAAIVNWYRLGKKPELGLQWSGKLDPAVADSPQVCAARAECLVILKQWDALLRLSKTRPWLGLEYLRHAYLSRAQFEKGERIPSTSSWTNAVLACHGDRARFAQIAFMAAKWNWVPQVREVLWAAADAPSPDWALDLLYQGYAAERNTAEMLHVARRMNVRHPENLRIKNNIALFSILEGENPQEALSIGHDLVNQKPDDPIYRSTYAFALLANGMPEESLAEMERLTSTQRKDPSFAPYFAFIYQANGDLTQAREFLAKVDRKRLLPEELALVDRLGNLN